MTIMLDCKLSLCLWLGFVLAQWPQGVKYCWKSSYLETAGKYFLCVVYFLWKRSRHCYNCWGELWLSRISYVNKICFSFGLSPQLCSWILTITGQFADKELTVSQIPDWLTHGLDNSRTSQHSISVFKVTFGTILNCKFLSSILSSWVAG